MRTRSLPNELLLIALFGFGTWGCTLTSATPGGGGGSSGGDTGGGGGVTDTGGQQSTGGTPIGGERGPGGATVSSGGTPSTGGTSSTGEATGGSTSAGGRTGNTGGTSSIGGTSNTGGTSSTGGATSVPTTGGRTGSTGGTSNTGGASSTGGVPSTGGRTASTGGTSSTGGATSTGGSTGAAGTTGTGIKGPCDIFQETDGKPCVAAHSTVRRLVGAYTGPLYQVRVGGQASGSGGTLTDILSLTDGFADSAAQDKACGTSSCTISKIYDQSGKGNHLTVAPAGGAKKTPDNEADAKARLITISGHKVYGEDGKAGVGYRNNKPNGTATGDNAETEYAIFDAAVYNKECCFDYGNMETNSMDNGEGTMEAIYWGNCTYWGKGSGSGPWIMGDLENGLWAGNTSPYSGNTSVTGQKYVVGFLKGDAQGKNHWAIKVGNPQSGTLKQMFDGVRPNDRYKVMRKEGAIGLNTGGDNSNSAIGVFFEGAMTAHFSSDAADNAVQANIVSVWGQ